ncbi:MAG: hypothetical protein DRO39_07795 [Thermoprotei archaeon]|nr:MAG: hypothetical protein DRO39_07795 [Thermoprotei archaeon]
MSGMLGDLFKQMGALGLTARPQLVQNELVIEITQEEFKNATTRNLDPRARDAISIQFEKGKMIIKIRLF